MDRHTASTSYVAEFATSIRGRGTFVCDRGSFAHDRDSFAHNRDSFAHESEIRDGFAREFAPALLTNAML